VGRRDLSELLEAIAEVHDEFEFEQTPRCDGYRVWCPGNRDGGWPDGAEHREKYRRVNDSTIVWVDNGWPSFACKHFHCDKNSEHGRKSFRHFLDAYDPGRVLIEYPRVDYTEMMGDLEHQENPALQVRRAKQ
jgi:hypothetical protein